MNRLSKVLLASVGIAVAGAAQAQSGYLMMPDSSANSVVLFDAFDGSVVNSNFINLDPINAGTPQHAITVGNEIWITDQIRDRVDRFTFDGQTHLGEIGGQVPGGGLDNIRGLAQIGDTVYVANAGTNNDAPGFAIVTIDAASASVTGSFSTGSESPWFVLEHNGDALVSTITNHHIDRYGVPSGNFIENIFTGGAGTARFLQQIHLMNNGNILAAGFSSASGGVPGVYEIDFDGNATLLHGESGIRGVWELGDGNVIFSSASGAFVLDTATGATTQVYSGTGRLFGFIPTPGALGVFALAGLAAARRRR